MANVSPTVLTTGMGSSGTTVYNTASVSPPANKIILIAIYNRRGGATGDVPTVTGNGLTWVNVVSATSDGANSRFHIFRAMGASPSAGAITITFPNSQQMAHWQVTYWDNASQVSAAIACPQGKAVSNLNNTTSMNATLDTAITKASHATYGGMGLVDVVGSGISPGDGETELADQTNNVTFNWRSQFQWKQGTDSNMAWGYPSGGNQPVGAFVEIAAALSGGGSPVMFQGGGVAVA